MKISLILFFNLFLFSCIKNDCEQIIIPANLRVLTNYNQNYSIETNKKVKLVHYFNANCSSCIGELEIWKNIIDSINQKNDIEIIFIGFTEDPKVSRYNLRRISFPYKIYYDSSQIFLVENKLIESNYTFLTDMNNVLLYEGNPLKDNKSILSFFKCFDKQ